MGSPNVFILKKQKKEMSVGKALLYVARRDVCVWWECDPGVSILVDR